MNPLPPNADELVSAYLDGQAAPDEIAAIESSPELLERARELRAIADRLGTPVLPPAEQKEAHLTAALDLFDQLFDAPPLDVAAAVAQPGDPGDRGDRGEGVPGAEAPGDRNSGTDLSANAPTVAANPTEADTPSDTSVISLDRARDRRRPRRFNTGVIAAAIAALLLVVGLAALNLAGTTTDDSASAGDDTVASAVDDAADTAADAAEDAADDAADMAMDADDRASTQQLESAPEVAAATDDAADAADGADTAAESEPTLRDEAENSDADESFALDSATEDSATDAGTSDEGASDDGESDAGATADSGGSVGPAAFLGAFEDVEALQSALDEHTTADLREFAAEVEDQLTGSGAAGCAADIVGIGESDTLTLIGLATVGEATVEVHAVDLATDTRQRGDEPTLLVIDTLDCSLVATLS